MNIAFRVDASQTIGTGHVTRCLTLARVLRERGAKCLFVSREHPGHMLDRIRGSEFDLRVLPTESSQEPTNSQNHEDHPTHARWLGAHWAKDARDTLNAIGQVHLNWLIVDHYALDYRWESTIKSRCDQIMAIDDLADRDHDCDLLLDQNLVAGWPHRYEARIPERCACLLGPKYALLQPEYAELHPRTPPRSPPISRIMAYFGGADNQNLTGLAIDSFLALQRADITLDVIINSNSQHAETIKRQVQGHANIQLHENLSSLAWLMLKADIAIGASGATSWERCCLGLPTLVVTLAENQRPIATELESLKLARYIGNAEGISLTTIGDAISDILRNEDQLEPWSVRCKLVCDGEGASRVASLILLHALTPLKARVARLEDEPLLLSWANDRLVRNNAFNANPIDDHTHRMWFYNRLRRPETCRIYIIETSNGIPIGQVRFERSHEEWEIHYGLAAFARRRGLGAPLVEVAIKEFRKLNATAPIFGRVKSHNLPSQRVFEKIGFTCMPASNGELIFRNR
jgi:UDP-2,4-diacetamido-2,4,6-trideoxy-beta-L-altropyranose hydrolase